MDALRLRLLALLGGCAFATLALVACAGSSEPPAPPHDASVADSSHPKSDAAPDGSTAETSDAAGFDTLVPLDDTGEPEDTFGPPPDGSRVEGVIGADGGTLSGAPSTPLEGVSLVVPAGALSSDTHLAIDVGVAGGLPGGATSVSPFVKVGPDGTLFAVPARLTLPYATTVGSPQLAMIAKIGLAWSSLLEPNGDATAKTLTASMRRASGAVVVLVDLSATTPTIAGFSPSSVAAGDVVFVDGSGFGLAPVWRPTADGGFTSSITVGGVTASATGWDDGSISFRAPAGDGGVITITTPGGSATSSTSLAMP